VYVHVGVISGLYRLKGVPWCDVTLLDDSVVSGRMFVPGGVMRWPVTLDMEAAVLVPDGKRNRALVFVGLESGVTAQEEDPTTVEVTHPAGLDVRRQRSNETQPVAVAALVDAIHAYQASVTQLLASLSAAAVNPANTVSAGALAAGLVGALTAGLQDLATTELATQGALPEATNPYKAKALRTN
jgi:hypothetical protein